MTSIVDPAEQDDDLGTTRCSTGESWGYREIINACQHNPALFLEIISRGTMKYQAEGAYEVITDDEMRLLAAARVLMEAGASMDLSADGSMTLTAGGNMTLKVGGNLVLDVDGVIQESATQHIANKR